MMVRATVILDQGWALARILMLGLLFFGVSMAVAIGLVMLNARISPDLPWFPLPVLLLLSAVSVWAGRRWDIGLPGRPVGSAAQTWGLTLAVGVLGVTLCLLQGAGSGMVRAAETVSGVTSPAFQAAYGITLGIVSAVLAEVVFRGIIQTRYAEILGPWPAILVVAAINTAAHRWGPALEAQWAAYFLSLAALGYLRIATGSLVPPLVAHGVANFLLGWVLWIGGPFDQGRLLTPGYEGALMGTIALAVVALLATWVLGRGLATRLPS